MLVMTISIRHVVGKMFSYSKNSVFISRNSLAHIKKLTKITNVCVYWIN